MLPRSPSTKLQGELAEVCFLWRATQLGFTISRPYGDARYDFVVDSGRTLHRVQVKSVSKPLRGVYRISTSSGRTAKKGYTSDEIDFLAGYVIPEDAWYIVPIALVPGYVCIHVCPHRRSRRKYERFREAWHLLRGCGADALVRVPSKSCDA